MGYRTFDSVIDECKKKNTDIFRQTADCIRRGEYTTPSGRTVQLDFTDMLKGSRCYQQEIQAISAPDVAGETRVLIENNDCLVTAERLVSEGYNPLLLNFASGGHPGGGVENIQSTYTLAISIFVPPEFKLEIDSLFFHPFIFFIYINSAKLQTILSDQSC